MTTKSPRTKAEAPAAKSKAEALKEYEAWYDEQVRLGLEDIKAGRVVPHEEVMKRTDRLLARLEKKHGRKAA
jgi:predicted transcriptional regulator